jgi:hypothetical protein
MRKNIFHPVAATFSLLALSTGLALGQAQTNDTVRVLHVKADAGCKNQAEADGNGAKLTTVLVLLENNINQGIDNTHKFIHVSVNLGDGGDERALTGNQDLLAAKYILTTSITEFKYDKTSTPNAETGIPSTQCTIHLSGSAEFKKPDGLTASANFEVSTNDVVAMNPNNLRVKNMGDDLLKAAAHTAANQIVSQVVSQ